MLSGMVSELTGFIRFPCKPAAEKSGTVMLSLKESRNGPPLLPLVPPEKYQPDPGGHPASWPLSVFFRKGEPTMKTFLASVLVVALAYPIVGQRIETQRA